MANFSFDFFYRISSPKYLNEFLNKGVIYMNTIEYFKGVEDNDAIGDIREGCCGVYQNMRTSIFNNGRWHKLPIIPTMWQHNTALNVGNIYCMMGISMSEANEDNNSIILIDEKLFAFGDTGVLVYNPKEFIRRVKAKCEELGYKSICNPVKYFDEKLYNGVLSPFMKRDKYEYQKEVRLFIPNVNNSPIKIELGSISDIAVRLDRGGLFKWDYDADTKMYTFYHTNKFDYNGKTK